MGGKFGGNGEKFGGNSDKNSNIKEGKNGEENFSIEASISPWQAALGGEVSIPLEGKFVKIKIPPLTKSGTRFKLKKEALNAQMPGIKADYTVVIKIDIRENLSKKELELYEKLRDLDTKTH